MALQEAAKVADKTDIVVESVLSARLLTREGVAGKPARRQLRLLPMFRAPQHHLEVRQMKYREWCDGRV
jgi:hypothetical protein